MMEIAFMAANPWGWGGSELLWSQTAWRLVQKGMAIGIYRIGWPGTPSHVLKLKQSGCVFEEREPDGRNTEAAAVAEKESVWLDRYRPEMAVISQGMSYDGIGWMRACGEREIPYAVIIQAAADHACPDGHLAQALADCFHQARRCYFVSAANIRLVEKQLGIQFKNCSIVRNPFNVPYEPEIGWPEGDSLNLACVARLDCRPKGQDILFEVLQESKWKNRRMKVNLYGEGLMRPTFERLIELWGLTNVKLCGFVADVESIWRNNHALILPSRFEGLPLAVVEAMLCGRIGIVTDAGGNAELIRDNIDGFVARAAKAEFLDEAMERAWCRRTQWQDMGRLASANIKKQLPPDPAEVFARELLMIFSSRKDADGMIRSRQK